MSEIVSEKVSEKVSLTAPGNAVKLLASTIDPQTGLRTRHKQRKQAVLTYANGTSHIKPVEYQQSLNDKSITSTAVDYSNGCFAVPYGWLIHFWLRHEQKVSDSKGLWDTPRCLWRAPTFTKGVINPVVARHEPLCPSW